VDPPRHHAGRARQGLVSALELLAPATRERCGRYLQILELMYVIARSADPWKDDASYRHQRFTLCRPAGRPAWSRFGVCGWHVSSECTDFPKRTSSVRRRRVIPLPSRQREMIRTMPLAAECTSQLPACKPNRPVSRLTWDSTGVPKGLRNEVYCSEGG
jgi:hypothetical protein